ncbi:MAG: RHS repeat-associated core domain-containing protein [Anaerolineales bacterium]|nr:RHS repeat-associated core domain-containing protein [Anaerolineales bacterium]
MLVNGDGTGGQAQGYMPWGETRYGGVGTEYQYTGQYRLAALGLDYYGARWYDPSLGRFAQADSIVPLASQGAQAWDRYAYANNNPVRYNDPSGHCTGDPNDKQNPDRACWIKLENLRKKYPNVSIDFRFDLDALKQIGKALSDALNAHRGDSEAFVRAAGNFSILYNPGVNRAYTDLSGSSIYLGRSVFFDKNNQPTTDAVFIILHEIAHVIDFKWAGGNPRNYKSQQFVNQFNTTSCYPQALGCVNSGYSNPIYRLLGGSDWIPSGDTTGYGGQASIEDFADSFAAYALTVSGQEYDKSRGVIGRERQDLIARIIWETIRMGH